MLKSGWYLLPIAFFLLVNSSVSYKVFFFEFLLYFIIIVLIYLSLSKYKLDSVIKILVILISLVVFIYGLIQKYYVFPKLLKSYGFDNNELYRKIGVRIESGRIFSIFTLPTLYGFIASVLILFIIHYILTDIKKKKILLSIFLIVLLIIGIYNLILTQSFGAILNLAVGLSAYMFMKRFLSVKYIALALMILSLITFIIIGLRYDEVKELEPIKLRLTNWNQALRMIKNAPIFGVGLGNYSANVSYFTKSGEAKSIYTHNFFLQLTTEIGLPIVFFILLFILYNRRKLIPESTKSGSIYLLVFGMIVLYNLIDIGLYFFSAGIIFAIVLSQLYPQKSKNYRINTVLLIIFLSIYGLLYLSDSNYLEANLLVGINKKEEACLMYEKSLKMNPYNIAAMIGKAKIEGVNSEKGNRMVENALSVFPEFGVGQFIKSIVEFKKGHLLTALTFAGAAYRKNTLNKDYGKWYEYIKGHLPARNIKKRN